MARGGIVSSSWDDAAIRESAENPAGDVGRAMRTLADETVRIMKSLAPVYSGPPRGPVPGHPRQIARRSGTLRSSIQHFRQPGGNYLIGPVDQVAPGVFLGPMIERGTRPHTITSHGRWPLYSAAAGRAYGPVVHHPGTAPHPFIARAAEMMNGRTITIR